jgi:hypothetical protein
MKENFNPKTFENLDAKIIFMQNGDEKTWNETITNINDRGVYIGKAGFMPFAGSTVGIMAIHESETDKLLYRNDRVSDAYRNGQVKALSQISVEDTRDLIRDNGTFYDN